jgi:hypothetical protein
MIMEHLKKPLVLSVASGIAILLLAWLIMNFSVHDPLFAILINWVLMSWVAFCGQFVRLSMPAGYHTIRPFEQSGQMYEAIGIRLFKTLVRRGPLAVFSPTLRFPKERSVGSLRWLDGEMRQAEAGHLLAFALTLAAAAFCALRGWLDAAGWLALFSLPINVYPVLLQRYNRLKLEALIVKQGGLERLIAGFYLGTHGEITWSRDELHER